MKQTVHVILDNYYQYYAAKTWIIYRTMAKTNIFLYCKIGTAMTRGWLTARPTQSERRARSTAGPYTNILLSIFPIMINARIRLTSRLFFNLIGSKVIYLMSLDTVLVYLVLMNSI